MSNSLSPTPLVRPFLKWPGGKFRLLSTLKRHIPDCTYLIEPFVGAGALFLNTSHPEVFLNDINPDLINLYRQLQIKSEQFISEARIYFNLKNNNAKSYYRLRRKFNQCDDLWERALLFLYLNRHGYNGLCRYNLKGGYNVPFGDYRSPYFPAPELAAFAQRTKKITFSCEDYASLLKRFLQAPNLQNKVFYCDPPYAPLSATANFTGYAAHRFTLEDQKQLAILAKSLGEKGATVIISNHDTPFTREIYQGAKLEHIEVSRTISCQTQTRHKVKELIVCYSWQRSRLLKKK